MLLVPISTSTPGGGTSGLKMAELPRANTSFLGLDLLVTFFILSRREISVVKLTASKAARRYIPDWPGIEKFKGVIHHSSFWPDEKIDVKGKRCAVIGTGASGVQIAQAWGPVAGELKVFQRTPNLAVPMRLKSLTPEEQQISKKWYPELFRYREKNFAGFLYDWYPKNTFDDTPEEREALYQKMWDSGGFHYWVGVYKDNLFNAKANEESYNFWAKKTRARIGDARKRDILAPLKMPHYFGVKRPCLESTYYEQFNRPTVDIVDIKNNDIKEFTETGITLADGTHYEFDAIAIATGFVSVSLHRSKYYLLTLDNRMLLQEVYLFAFSL